MADDLATHYQDVADELVEGNVIPFLGAGANLCGRPEDAHWTVGQGEYMPNAYELAFYLAQRFRYPAADEKELDRVASDLARVSQYVAIQRGSRRLYTELHKIFSPAYRPSPLHRFFARLPSLLRARRSTSPYQLIVTTNYDDALETAFNEAGEKFDLVWYMAEGEGRGKFMHQAPGADPVVVERPNECIDLAPEQRSVILKIHGDVDRSDPSKPGEDSFVITEDDYIEFLTHSTDPANLIPIGLLDRMKENAFLFLGYSLRDWNLRVILYRLWREQTLGSQSWAVQRKPMSFERKFWSLRRVELLDIDLDDYIRRLEHAVEGNGSPS
jgi:SIR2-like domain